jgi:hypothetical protein
MALTLNEMTADVRQLLNESTAVFWTDAEIQDWLYEGTRIIASKTLSIEADDDITLVTNQLIYNTADGVTTWAADCLEPYAAIYDDGSYKYKGLEKIHPKQLGNVMTFTPGPPRYYAFHNRSFYIWPVPTSSENGNTISVLYATESQDPTVLTDEYQHLAIQWAFARAKEKDQKFAEAAAIKQNFYTEMQFERQDKVAEQGEGVQSVKTGKSTVK